MMASFRLENVANQTISFSLQIMVSEMKTPKGRNLSRISDHCLNEAPSKHSAKHMIEK